MNKYDFDPPLLKLLQKIGRYYVMYPIVPVLFNGSLAIAATIVNIRILTAYDFNPVSDMPLVSFQWCIIALNAFFAIYYYKIWRG